MAVIQELPIWIHDPGCILVSLPDDGPMRLKHVEGNKYAIVNIDWLKLPNYKRLGHATGCTLRR
jgi:hypothetical protein